MRPLAALLLALPAVGSLTTAEPPGPPAPAPPAVTIAGATKYAPHALVRLRAEGTDAKAALLWRVHPARDVQRATTPRGLLEFAAPPGRYQVELIVLTATPAGIDAAEAFLDVEIAAGPAAPSPKPPEKANPAQAIGRLKTGPDGQGRYAGCTATVVHPRRPDGRWDVLTAAHCTPGVGARGTFTLKDGRAFAVVVTARDPNTDLAWLRTEEGPTDLPYAVLAKAVLPAGTPVWHMGFGVDRPGNREDGQVVGPETSWGQLPMELNVSSGDSGGGIFHATTDELVAAVCCTTEKGRKVTMLGGSCVQAWKLRPTAASPSEAEWAPLPIPLIAPPQGR